MSNTETQVKTGNVKITEALELLNEAAKDKKEELKGLFTDKYSHIRQAMNIGSEQSKEMLDKAKQFTQETLKNGKEKLNEVVTEAEKRIRKDPWAYVAGAAAFTLVVGFILGSKRK